MFPKYERQNENDSKVYNKPNIDGFFDCLVWNFEHYIRNYLLCFTSIVRIYKIHFSFCCCEKNLLSKNGFFIKTDIVIIFVLKNIRECLKFCNRHLICGVNILITKPLPKNFKSMRFVRWKNFFL